MDPVASSVFCTHSFDSSDQGIVPHAAAQHIRSYLVHATRLLASGCYMTRSFSRTVSKVATLFDHAQYHHPVDRLSFLLRLAASLDS